jgi:plastocyanin
MTVKASLAVMLTLAPVLPTGANAAQYVVAMSNMKFGPAPAHLRVGDTIVWKNSDMFRHTATAKGVFDVDLPPGKSGTVTLGTPGMLDIACRFHPTMKLHLAVAK